jgi:MYXO-CTERM domain-containing protein
MRQSFVLGSVTGALALFFVRDARATVYEITPADDLEASIAALVPGDELVLGGGTYTLNGFFEIGVSGADGQPIVIRNKEGETPVITQQAAQNIVNVAGAYITLRGLEFTAGDRGIRIQNSYVTVEDCHVHDTGANAISANDGGVDYAGIVLRRNHIHHTGGVGEGMYLGCNDNGCQFHDAVIENNWIHDTNGPTVDQGDGIEIKEGSYGNVVRDNVIHDTGYPCIITYSTVGNGAPNVVERNVMWGCGDHGIQSAADVVIRNNIILCAAADGIRNQPHQAGDPQNIEIVHNTVLKAGGDAIRSDGIVGSVLIANNAIYAQSGNAIRVAGDLGAVTVAGNVGTGSLQGISSGFAATGSLSDFVAASFSGAPPNDVFPASGSMLLGAGDAAHVATDDFNGTPRNGQADAGAYKFDAAGNPGWTIGPGFKDTPAGQGGGGEGGSGSGPGGSTTGSGAGATGSGAGSTGSGAGGGDGASDGGEDDGCGCVTAGGPAGTNALSLAALLGAVAALFRRASRR